MQGAPATVVVLRNEDGPIGRGRAVGLVLRHVGAIGCRRRAASMPAFGAGCHVAQRVHPSRMSELGAQHRPPARSPASVAMVTISDDDLGTLREWAQPHRKRGHNGFPAFESSRMTGSRDPHLARLLERACTWKCRDPADERAQRNARGAPRPRRVFPAAPHGSFVAQRLRILCNLFTTIMQLTC